MLNEKGEANKQENSKEVKNEAQSCLTGLPALIVAVSVREDPGNLLF